MVVVLVKLEAVYRAVSGSQTSHRLRKYMRGGLGFATCPFVTVELCRKQSHVDGKSALVWAEWMRRNGTSDWL